MDYMYLFFATMGEYMYAYVFVSACNFLISGFFLEGAGKWLTGKGLDSDVSVKPCKVI